MLHMCSDWLIPVFRSGHPSRKIEIAFKEIFNMLVNNMIFLPN